MFGVTKPAPLASEAHKIVVRETPFVIPAAEDKETAVSYITALKANAPFEYCHMGGISFEKGVLPESATIPSNSGKVFFPRLVSKLLTKKQADAIWAEAAKREVHVPRIKNPEYDPEHAGEEPTHIAGGYFKISEWLILEPEATFDPRKYPTAETPWTNPTTTPPTAEEIQTKLLEEQRQARTKK